MNELHRELDRLATGVADEGTAERMLGRVGPMVAAVRRRRAARRTGFGMAAVGSVAAVALLVPGLIPRTGTEPGPAASTSWSLTAGIQCGDPLPDLATAAELPATLVVGLRGTQPGGLSLVEHVSNPTADEVPLERDDTLTVMVVRDGEIAGLWSGATTLSGALEAWTMAGSEGGTLRLTTCQPGSAEGMLTDGEYDVYAVRSDAQGAPLGVSGPLVLEVDGARTTMAGLVRSIATVQNQLAELTREAGAGAKVTTTETGGTDDRPGEAEAAAEAAIAALRAAGPAAGATFPACATTVPAPDPDAVLALGLGTTSVPEGTEPVQLLATLSTTGGRTVLGNAPLGGAGLTARLVFTREGVVVGAGYVDAEDVDLVALGPTDWATVTALGRATVCASPQTDAVGLPLPAGDYVAYAVLEVALKEVTEAGGPAVSRSDLITVVSAPAEVTITAP